MALKPQPGHAKAVLEAPPIVAQRPAHTGRRGSPGMWLRVVLVMALSPLMTYRYLHKGRANEEPQWAGAGQPPYDPFDPLGLDGPQAYQMSKASGSSGGPAGQTAVGLATKGSGDPGPQLYQQRWVQLAYLSVFALISDWVCFSVAAAPEAWHQAYGRDPAQLVDLFLFTNVFSCFWFTDVADYFGLRKVVVGAASLMAAGCLLRSGVPFMGGLPSYNVIILGTMLVGAAQPFFQCSPPLLSATWFGAKERAVATAVAIKFNQVGIAAAFIAGGVLGESPAGLGTYFSIITVLTTVAAIASYFQFQDLPPTPPSASAVSRFEEIYAAKERNQFELKFPSIARELLSKKAFRIPLVGFVSSIAVTNIISTFTDSSLRRAGFLDVLEIDLAGAGFQLATVVGGIFVCSYVDRTKRFRWVTLRCLNVAGVLLLVLSVAFGYDLNLSEWAVLACLLGVGATLGPLQPITAELAVEATYPSDENAIEAVQQLCGNLFSALLVPLCEVVSAYDLDLTFGLADVRGDSIVLLLLLLVTSIYFSTFDAPLKRSEMDDAAEQ